MGNEYIFQYANQDLVELYNAFQFGGGHQFQKKYVYRHVGVRGSVVSVLTELTSSTTLICALEPHHDLDSRTPTPTQTIVSRMNSNVTSWVTDFERRSLPARST